MNEQVPSDDRFAPGNWAEVHRLTDWRPGIAIKRQSAPKPKIDREYDDQIAEFMRLLQLAKEQDQKYRREFRRQLSPWDWPNGFKPMGPTL